MSVASEEFVRQLSKLISETIPSHTQPCVHTRLSLCLSSYRHPGAALAWDLRIKVLTRASERASERWMQTHSVLSGRLFRSSLRHYRCRHTLSTRLLPKVPFEIGAIFLSRSLLDVSDLGRDLSLNPLPARCMNSCLACLSVSPSVCQLL